MCFNVFQRRLARNSDEPGHEGTGGVKQLPPADVDSQSAVAECEGSVDITTPTNSPGRVSSSCKRRMCPSPVRMPQLTTALLDDCHSAVSKSSPVKSLAKCETTSNSPLGDSGRGSPLPKNRRRSSRSLKVTQLSEQLTAESDELVTSPKCVGGAARVSPVRQSPRSKCHKSPQSPRVLRATSSNLSQPLRSSPRKLTAPVNDADSNLVGGGHAMKSIGANGDQHHIGNIVSPRKIVSSENVDPAVSSGESADAVKDPLRVNNRGDDQPLSGLSKQLPAVPDKAALLVGTTKPDKKRTGVRNRRKSSSSYSQPEEKRSRSRFRSLEPALREKFPRVHRPRRKTDTVGIRAEVAQSLPALADTGCQLRRRRKPSNDDQCGPTPADKELESIEQKDDPDLLQCCKEVTVKKEPGDEEASVVTGLNDSNVVTPSSDDVRTIHIQLLQLSKLFYLSRRLTSWLMSVCVSSNLLQIATSTVFSLIPTKLGTHDVCASTQKTVEQIFAILRLKLWANF